MTGNGLYGHGRWEGEYQDALDKVRASLRKCLKLEQERYSTTMPVGARMELETELQYAYNEHLEALHTAKRLRPPAPLSGLPR